MCLTVDREKLTRFERNLEFCEFTQYFTISLCAAHITLFAHPSNAHCATNTCRLPCSVYKSHLHCEMGLQVSKCYNPLLLSVLSLTSMETPNHNQLHFKGDSNVTSITSSTCKVTLHQPPPSRTEKSPRLC